MSDKKSIGKKITAIRELKELSLEEVASRCNLQVDQLQKIEKDEEIPSLSPLIKIARALGVRLGTFLDDNDEMGPVVTRAKRMEQGSSFSNKNSEARVHMDFFPMAGNKNGRHMEPFIVEVNPAYTEDFILSSHEGEEFIYVLEGTIEISYGKESYTLYKGDSIYYDSIVSHNVHCLGEETAKILAVIYSPF
jgi:transcriptional regulator with XRE-family HTH domain